MSGDFMMRMAGRYLEYDGEVVVLFVIRDNSE